MRGLNDIAAVVVLFNPKDEAIKNILSFAPQVHSVYVVDNSTAPNNSLIDSIKVIDKVTYINNGGNRGIAHALNEGAGMAVKAGYKYLLTMDQDTHLPAEFVSRLINYAPANMEKVGLLAPRYTALAEGMPDHEEVLITMTSGNIINLEAYSAVGPFIDELFIDHVDHEYCLRLWKNDFKVVQVNQVEILHRPGSLIEVDFVVKKVAFSSHAPLRLYYFCRNGFYVSNLYRRQFPAFTKYFRKLLRKEILKIPFERDRIDRVRRLVRGYRDYKTGALGPLKTR